MNQKGFANIILLIIGVAVLIGATGYFAVIKQMPLNIPVISPTPIPTTPKPDVDKGMPPRIQSLSPSSGNIGTSVTIVGSGFTDQNVVRFGTDYSGYLNSTDGVSLTFVIPAEQDECHPSGSPCLEIRNIPVTAGVFDVYVMNKNGTSNKLRFTVQNKQSEYICRVLCTGAVPSPKVEQDCLKLQTQEQCISYTSDEFPFKCEWQLTSYQCLLP